MPQVPTRAPRKLSAEEIAEKAAAAKKPAPKPAKPRAARVAKPRR
jgi:hypothetical protein